MPRKRQGLAYAPGSAYQELGADLLRWFATHQRDLPWRRSRDPYRIWVSEVMLQQTRVETVIPYYQRWFQRFPTIEALAAAEEAEVLKAWEGLGYYSRARNLHSAAQEVLAAYGGTIPDDPERVGALRGVGSYTAGAILSIAYNRPVPAVDGNVMRVLSRLYLIQDDIARPATRKAMEALARELIPPGQASSFNQALMELGALLCTPTSPRCTQCPVAVHCRARQEGEAESLPVKAAAKAPRAVDVVAAVVAHQGRFLLVRRPSRGLLGGLWEFPGGQRPDDLPWSQAVHTLLAERFSLEVAVEQHLCDVRHVFTHLVWNLKAYTASVIPGSPVPAESADLRWVPADQIGNYALPVAHQKVASQYLACSGGTGLVE